MDQEFILSLPRVPYGSTGTIARYDEQTNTYYNEFGQDLRDPEEYDCDYEDGWTPMGDE